MAERGPFLPGVRLVVPPEAEDQRLKAVGLVLLGLSAAVACGQGAMPERGVPGRSSS